MTATKILWGEGLFLRPHHFQAQDHYLESLTKSAQMHANPYAWGIVNLKIDTESLNKGTLVVNEVRAIFPSGESVNAPEMDQLPAPLSIAELVQEESWLDIHIALPCLSLHGDNCKEDRLQSGTKKYLVVETVANDQFTNSDPATITTLSKLPCLRTSEEPLDQYEHMLMLRIRRTASSGYEVDWSHVAPSLTINSSRWLLALLRRQIDALTAKIEALYGHHREPSKNIIEFRSGDVASFWLLHTANTACASLTHLFRTSDNSPEKLFIELTRLAGSLLTFSRAYSLNDLPAYNHAQPGPCFGKLELIIRDLLDTVISTRYFAIILTNHKPSFYSGILNSEKITRDTVLYISITASHTQAELIDSIPHRLKIGAPDDVDKLVLSAMSGVRLTHAAQVPSAIPIRPGATYFELDVHSPLYDRMLKAQSISIYVPDSYSDLKIELLAVIS